jgi:hypothetical protein
MIYTTQEGQSFDPEILRQELVAAIGADGWYISTAGNQVTFVEQRPMDVEAVIVDEVIGNHFANGAVRTANATLLKQIAELESQQTPRRIREALVDPSWMQGVDAQIAALRGALK